MSKSKPDKCDMVAARISEYDGKGRWVLVDRIASALRSVDRAAEKRGHVKGYVDGYAQGHDEQMRARILDARERKARR